MDFVVSLVHQKGGVGKTTLSLNLYESFTQDDMKCVLVDTDLQGSTTDTIETLARLSGNPPANLIKRSEFSQISDLPPLLKDFDVALIDTPPYQQADYPTIFALSNVVLIPMKVSPLDYYAAEKTLQLVSKYKTPQSKVVAVLTMTVANSTLPTEFRGLVSDYGYAVLETEIGNRVSYAKSLFSSHSVFGESDPKAKDEITRLKHEILKLF